MPAPESLSGPSPVGSDSLGRSIGGDLVYLIESDPGQMAPTLAGCGASCTQILSSVADPMFGLSQDGDVVPVLLDSYEAKDDFFTWVLTLREGIRFHDGLKLDAAALAQHIESCRASPITSAWFAPIDRVETGVGLVVLHLNEPWASLPEMMVTSPCNLVLRPDSPPFAPIGTGPFVVSTVSSGQVRLEKNIDYWRGDSGLTGEGLPLLDSIEFVVQSDIAKSLDLIESGQAGSVQSRSSLSGATSALTSNIGSETYQLIFNVLNEKQAGLDGACRQFLSSALDRVRAPYTDQASVPPVESTLTFDEACSRFLETGDGTVTLLASTDPTSQRLAQMVREHWNARSKGRIVVNLDSVNGSELGKRSFAGDFEVLIWSNSAGLTPEASFPWWHSSSSLPLGEVALNVGRFVSPEVDAALKLVRLDPDAGAQASLLIEEAISAGAYVVWLERIEWTIVSGGRLNDLASPISSDGIGLEPLVNGVHSLSQVWCDSALC